MTGLSKKLGLVLTGLLAHISMSCASINQTDDLSPILPETGLPFHVEIEQANFTLPQGLHSGAFAVYKGLWVFFAGRTNGLHGFNPADNFPPSQQNTRIYVVNPLTGAVTSRSLHDPSSGLTQDQIDTLSVTSPQAYQDGNALYMTGGYGINTNTGLFETKPVLTAINLPGIVSWVTEPKNPSYSVIQNIQQLSTPCFSENTGVRHKTWLEKVVHIEQRWQNI